MTDIALFTNLTQDHLDYFENMQNYAKAKRMFFEDGYAKFGVVNIDDPFGRDLFETAKIPILTYARQKGCRNEGGLKIADIIASNAQHNTNSQTFTISTPKGEKEVRLNLSGGFNISNALGAIGAGLLSGIDLDTIIRGLDKLDKVEGRFNCYNVGGVRVVVDYAHTPDGLENILKAAREITEGDVISVFGCGGNRDALKRPIMGEISSRLADFTIITSDNPRFERPEDIAKDIEKGMSPVAPYSVILDRTKAIRLAISMAGNKDTVVVAGKGSEPYIDMLGVKTPYEDRLVIEEIIKGLQ